MKEVRKKGEIEEREVGCEKRNILCFKKVRGKKGKGRYERKREREDERRERKRD